MGSIISTLFQYLTVLKESAKGLPASDSLSLKEFLDICNLKNIQKLSPSNIKICCGNQSADMDSVVSALTYSYLNYMKNDQLILPVLNIPLIFMQDIKILKKKFKNNLVVDAILVDHNEPQGLGVDCIDRIIGIIDHHEDTKKYDSNLIKSLGNPLIIETCGSCSSLVTNYWYPQIKDIYLLPEEIVRLGMAAALLDTSNFKSKVEDQDLEALAFYQKYFVSAENMKKDILKPFFKTLKNDKQDIEGFDMYDLLRKDFKLFEFNGFKIGMSSLGSSMENYIKSFGCEDIDQACNKYLRLNNMDLLLLLTSYSDESKNHKRQLITFNVQKSDLQKTLIEKITQDLELVKIDSISELDVYDQQKSRASRKQIAPIVDKALHDL